MRTRWRLRRGTWAPGRTSFALFTIEVVMAVQAAVRGVDYLRPDEDVTSLLSKVQDAAPLHVWAVLFIASAALVVVGWVSRWGRVIAGGHMLAMICYAAVGYGVFEVTALGPGVRTPSGLMFAAVIHGALGFSILATLRRREVTRELDDDLDHDDR